MWVISKLKLILDDRTDITVLLGLRLYGFPSETRVGSPDK